MFISLSEHQRLPQDKNCTGIVFSLLWAPTAQYSSSTIIEHFFSDLKNLNLFEPFILLLCKHVDKWCLDVMLKIMSVSTQPQEQYYVKSAEYINYLDLFCFVLIQLYCIWMKLISGTRTFCDAKGRLPFWVLQKTVWWQYTTNYHHNRFGFRCFGTISTNISQMISHFLI